jgi:hypothetical protein
VLAVKSEVEIVHGHVAAMRGLRRRSTANRTSGENNMNETKSFDQSVIIEQAFAAGAKAMRKVAADRVMKLRGLVESMSIRTCIADAIELLPLPKIGDAT